MDFVVDADPSRVRTLVAQYPDFELKFNNLFYKSGNKVVKVDTFDKDTFKMPDLANVYSKTFKPHHKPGRRLSVPREFNNPPPLYPLSNRIAMLTIPLRYSPGDAPNHDLHGQTPTLGPHRGLRTPRVAEEAPGR